LGRQTYFIYVAVSADGYIAGKDGGIGWLHEYAGDAFGIDSFLARVETIVMGRVTYSQALGMGGGWPYGGKRVVVLTSKALPKNSPAGVAAWRGGVPALKASLDQSGYPVWIAGGARTISAALGHGLAHQLDLFIIPRLLGDGIPLFLPGSRPTQLRLLEAVQLPRDVVHLKYEIL